MKKIYQSFIALALIGSLNLSAATEIVFSFNRPIQLYAFLESSEKNVTGIDKTYVLYRTDGPYADAYKQVEERFKDVVFVKQQNKNDFKSLLMNILNTVGEFVIFGTDDIVVRDQINLTLGEHLLQKTGAYGFYYRLGKNITKCYPLGGIKTPPPAMKQVANNVYQFSLSAGSGDWNYPNTVDMMLVRTKDIKSLFATLNFRAPNSLEGEWAGHANYNAIGLCPEVSAAVNFPINIVQTEWPNPTSKSHSPEMMLQKFKDGFKIDIVDASAFLPESPHTPYHPKFITR